MSKPLKHAGNALCTPVVFGGVEPHHLPHTQKPLKKGLFWQKGHKRDTIFRAIKRMMPPSEPKINKDNPKKYFIYWNQDVPSELWDTYQRKRIRIKKYDDINRYSGDERERIAEERLLVWRYALTKLNYNPFEDELNKLQEVANRHQVVEVVKKKEKLVEILTPLQQRRQLPINKALDLFLESRGDRTKNRNSIASYGVTVRWIKKYFEDIERVNQPANTITRQEIADALIIRKRDNKWEPTTYNNELGFLITIFNWLVKEEYMESNPINDGKIEPLPTQKHKHRWFDRDVKKQVKDELIRSNEMLVYRVMQFTYMILIRSKTELMKLKAGDIDRKLKRVRYSADLSKNNREAYRDYPPEFDQVLDEIDFNNIPPNFYIFGRKGEPSEFKCHKDLFADRWRPVRDRLGLSDDYNIYGMRHTRIVHELFKGTDGYDLSYMARHEDPKSTSAYQRDYDITLKNKYGPEDLMF